VQEPHQKSPKDHS